jgi:hypothetical protein
MAGGAAAPAAAAAPAVGITSADGWTDNWLSTDVGAGIWGKPSVVGTLGAFACDGADTWEEGGGGSGSAPVAAVVELVLDAADIVATAVGGERGFASWSERRDAATWLQEVCCPGAGWPGETGFAAATDASDAPPPNVPTKLPPTAAAGAVAVAAGAAGAG